MTFSFSGLSSIFLVLFNFIYIGSSFGSLISYNCFDFSLYLSSNIDSLPTSWGCGDRKAFSTPELIPLIAYPFSCGPPHLSGLQLHSLSQNTVFRLSLQFSNSDRVWFMNEKQQNSLSILFSLV